MLIRSHSEKDTYEFAEKFALTLSGGEIIELSGELGAGKTVFVKGLCKGLGVSDEVLSPTFTVMNDYRGSGLDVYHYDAYRLSSGEEAYYSGLTDYFGLKSGVCVIEWAENIADALKDFETIKIEIRYTGEDSREIHIHDGKDKS